MTIDRYHVLDFQIANILNATVARQTAHDLALLFVICCLELTNDLFISSLEQIRIVCSETLNRFQWRDARTRRIHGLLNPLARFAEGTSTRDTGFLQGFQQRFIEGIYLDDHYLLILGLSRC